MEEKKALTGVSQSDCTPHKRRKVAKIPIKPLQNYRFISTLLPVTRLSEDMYEGVDKLSQDFKSSFELPLSEYLRKKIKDSARLPGDDPYAVQVLVRIGLDDGSWMQRETFPQCIMKVNRNFVTSGKNVMVFDAETNSQPVNITKYCLVGRHSVGFSRSVFIPPITILTIEWLQNCRKAADFYITVIVAEKLTIPEIVERVIKEGVRHPYNTGKMAQEEIESYTKNGLSCTSIKTSLICPLGKTRIVTPCRGTFCSHLQCVDAFTLLNMNEGRTDLKRICWLCNRSLGDIHADGLFLEILQSVPSDVEEVIFNSDGRWICESKDRAIQISGSYKYQLDPAGVKPHIDKIVMKITTKDNKHKVINGSKDMDESLKRDFEQSSSSNLSPDVKVEVESSLEEGRESEDVDKTVGAKSIQSTDEDSSRDSKSTDIELVESSDGSTEKDSCLNLDVDILHHLKELKSQLKVLESLNDEYKVQEVERYSKEDENKSELQNLVESNGRVSLSNSYKETKLLDEDADGIDGVVQSDTQFKSVNKNNSRNKRRGETFAMTIRKNKKTKATKKDFILMQRVHRQHVENEIARLLKLTEHTKWNYKKYKIQDGGRWKWVKTDGHFLKECSVVLEKIPDKELRRLSDKASCFPNKKNATSRKKVGGLKVHKQLVSNESRIDKIASTNCQVKN